MYCKNCGREVNDNAVICPYCGVQLQSFNQSNGGVYQQNKTNKVAIVGFVLSFFVALAGLICSIIGFNKAKNEGLPYKNLALAGIIISIVNMILGIILDLYYYLYFWPSIYSELISQLACI